MFYFNILFLINRKHKKMSIRSTSNSRNLMTGIKDIDKLVLNNIEDDRKLLDFCSLNKNYYVNVCDEIEYILNILKP